MTPELISQDEYILAAL